MTPGEYALAQRAFGQRVVCQNGRFWRRVRPCFFRPLLVWEPITEARVALPGAFLGGCQYVVANGGEANSTLSFLVYDRPHEYALAEQSHNRRRLILLALKNFVFKSVSDPREFKEQGYFAYLDFYRRTNYAYKSERTRRSGFEKWADALFGIRKAVVVGGYDSRGLAAVSVSYWVNDTLVYATLFSATEALRKHVCEGMLHVIRQIACEQAGIQQVLARTFDGGCGRDHYYLLRGCALVRKPARLVLKPVTHALLKTFLATQYAKVRGG